MTSSTWTPSGEVAGLTDRPRLPRLGKIHLGVKSQGDRGYPKATDHFVCPEVVQKIYGPRPRELEGEYLPAQVIVQRPDQLALARAQALRYLRGAEESVSAMTEVIRHYSGNAPRGMARARHHIKRAVTTIKAAGVAK